MTSDNPSWSHWLHSESVEAGKRIIDAMEDITESVTITELSKLCNIDIERRKLTDLIKHLINKGVVDSDKILFPTQGESDRAVRLQQEIIKLEGINNTLIHKKLIESGIVEDSRSDIELVRREIHRLVELGRFEITAGKISNSSLKLRKLILIEQLLFCKSCQEVPREWVFKD